MDDLISGQAAIEHFQRIIDATNTDGKYNLGFIDGLEFCINHLSTMPSTQPERKKGKWINPSQNPEFANKDFFNDCSVCGFTTMDKSNFCPRCGAEMEAEK